MLILDIYQYIIYTGKTEGSENDGLGYNVVTELCQDVPQKSLVVFDDFFTSCKLMQDLYAKQLYAIGKVRPNRKGLPDFMRKKQSKKEKLQNNEFYCDPITAIKWLYTKEVTVITTANQPHEVTMIRRTQRNGTKKHIMCPKVIADYTLNMGGVNHFHHLRELYPISRKSRKSWMRLFFFIFDASIINAYIMYTRIHGKKNHSHRDFRLHLGRAL